MVRFAILLSLLAAAGDSKPRLAVRAFPAMSLANQGDGCSSILLTAEIKGPEVESWYCPKVEWELPDGTTATEESDCAPFEERTEFPRIWRRRVCAPPHPTGQAWTVHVRFTRNGKTIARQGIEFHVR